MNSIKQKINLLFVVTCLLTQCTNKQGTGFNAGANVAADSLKARVYAWSETGVGLPDSAIIDIEELRRISEVEGKYTDLVTACKARFLYYRSRDNFPETYQSTLQRLDAARLSNDSQLIIDATYSIGRLLFMNGSYYESLDYFLQIADMDLPANFRATLFYTLAQVYLETGDNNQELAANYYDLAEEEMSKPGFTNTTIKSFILFGRANLYLPSEPYYFDFVPLQPSRADSLRKAIEIFEEAFEVFEGNYMCPLSIALCHAKLGQVQQSRLYENIILELASTKPELLGVVDYVRSIVRFRERRFDEAIAIAVEGMESSLAKRDLSNAQKNMTVLYHTYRETGETGQALHFLERSTALNDSIMKKEKQEQAILNQIKYDTKFKEEQIREANRRNKEILFRFRIFATVGVVFIILSAILFRLYRLKEKALNALVLKNKQWAGVQVVEESETMQTPDSREPPDATDRLVMDDIQKRITAGLYKDGNLTLDLLAEKTGLHPNFVSNVVNRCTGKNFKTYINEYRIKEAIRMLSDRHFETLTFDYMAIETGFTNRINFYRVFKKTTGLSPSEFKKKQDGLGSTLGFAAN